MTPKRVLTIFAFLALIIFAGIMAWDVCLYTDAVAGNSITQATIYYSHQYPIIAWAWGFGMGALIGHFWL